MAENWIQRALKPSSKGKLHKKLGVPLDDKIPEAKLSKAAHSKNPNLKKEAVLAQTIRGLRKRK
jgi:hypothetical protein